MLLPTDPGYQRRIEVRNRYLTQNAANELKRCDLRYTAWTEIYAAIVTATADAAPMFSRQLRDLCDMSIARSGRDAVPGGYFDGPLAWRMLNHNA